MYHFISQCSSKEFFQGSKRMEITWCYLECALNVRTLSCKNWNYLWLKPDVCSENSCAHHVDDVQSLYQQTQLLKIFWEIVITLWMLLWILWWNGEPIFRHMAWFWKSWLSLIVLYRCQLFCVCQNQKATLRPSVHSNLLVTGYRCYCIQILRPRRLFKTRKKKKEIADSAERPDHYI